MMQCKSCRFYLAFRGAWCRSYRSALAGLPGEGQARAEREHRNRRQSEARTAGVVGGGWDGQPETPGHRHFWRSAADEEDRHHRFERDFERSRGWHSGGIGV